jgi:eukaryotic-like serine/threonine-protein kinase
MTSRTLALAGQRWTLSSRIGDRSGFGQVFLAVADDGTEGVVKLVPKDPGADRELLFVNLAGKPNIVPIIDSGETRTHWALAMPKADRSLRAELEGAPGPLAVNDAIPILTDIATALAALAGEVVHRDLKPENVLLLTGTWSLADFGIARYAEATTSSNTWKDAWSAPYAAPERWQHRRAETATDVYSFGVMAFEMLAGAWPFLGPDRADFRDQHLRDDPPSLPGVPVQLAGLVTECLFKDPGARPTAANVLARLGRVSAPPSRGAAALRAANAAAQSARAREQAEASAAADDEGRRAALVRAARTSFSILASSLRDAVSENAPAAVVDPGSKPDDWSFKLGPATLGIDPPHETSISPWGLWTPSFEVVAHAAIGVTFPPDQWQYGGRSHSLWYCDAQHPAVFRWYETAFMVMPLIAKRLVTDPRHFNPGEEAGKALATGMNEWQVAWPFTPIDQGDGDAFIERWIEWFGLGASGSLRHPSNMPERPAEGSWRR